MSRFWPYLVLLGEADRPSLVKKYFFASVCVRVCGRASGPARPRAQRPAEPDTHTVTISVSFSVTVTVTVTVSVHFVEQT